VRLASDLHKNLENADQFEARLVTRIDSFIEENQMTVSQETLPKLTAGFDLPERDELDLKKSGIRSVIWATGYSFDFSMVRLPILDSDGYPVQRRGVTEYPGLYFLGMPWLHNARSGLIFGVSEDADYVASHISARQHSEVPGSTRVEAVSWAEEPNWAYEI
jgi:putative flavoprotein involved in K+ transport